MTNGADETQALSHVTFPQDHTTEDLRVLPLGLLGVANNRSFGVSVANGKPLSQTNV